MRTVDAHMRVQAAARQVSADLDDVEVPAGDDAPVATAIARARLRLTPAA